MKDDETPTVLHVDNFLSAVGLRPADIRLTSPAMRDALFRVATEYLMSRNLASPLEAHEGSFAEASSRIPQTAFVVRLSAPTGDELKALIAAGAALLALGAVDGKTLTAVGAVTMMNRIKKAHKEYGEVSILDAVQELRRPTAVTITKFLFGNPCRYPSSACRFLDQGGNCSIGGDAVATTMADMVSRGILRHKNSVEPIEYGIVT
jgi:hypothetical protein